MHRLTQDVQGGRNPLGDQLLVTCMVAISCTTTVALWVAYFLLWKPFRPIHAILECIKYIFQNYIFSYKISWDALPLHPAIPQGALTLDPLRGTSPDPMYSPPPFCDHAYTPAAALFIPCFPFPACWYWHSLHLVGRWGLPDDRWLRAFERWAGHMFADNLADCSWGTVLCN